MVFTSGKMGIFQPAMLVLSEGSVFGKSKKFANHMLQYGSLLLGAEPKKHVHVGWMVEMFFFF